MVAPLTLARDGFNYSGDVGSAFEHGGLWIRVATDGTYADVIECIGTDAADPEWMQGRALIQAGSVCLERHTLRDWRRAIRSCGWLPRALRGLSRPARRAMLAEAMIGHYGADFSREEWAGSPTAVNRLAREFAR